MKVFISHSSKDYELSKTLKDILEQSEHIDEAFIFEDKKSMEGNRQKLQMNY